MIYLLRHCDRTAEAPEAPLSAKGFAQAQPLLTASALTLLVTHGGWLSVVLGQFGRAVSFESLFAIKSPDLFSIGPETWQNHEL